MISFEIVMSPTPLTVSVSSNRQVTGISPWYQSSWFPNGMTKAVPRHRTSDLSILTSEVTTKITTGGGDVPPLNSANWAPNTHLTPSPVLQVKLPEVVEPAESCGFSPKIIREPFYGNITGVS